MPVLASLARRSEVGRAATIPEGFPSGSDVGNMSIFGFDPSVYHTGRAPIEAAALGIEIADDQVAFRCNLVKVGADSTMLDFAGGHPSNAAAARVIAALDSQLGTDEIGFFPGVQYRHIFRAPTSWEDAFCVPPHDLTDKPAVLPSGPAARRLIDIMNQSKSIVEPLLPSASQVWLWGQGRRPTLRPFADVYGVQAGLVSAVDLVRGIGVLADMHIAEVDGITGHYDTNYEGKRDAALNALAAGMDLFVVHVEATDEAGHAGDVEEKVKALENWDSRILAGLVEGLDSMGPWRMLLMPDHATPLETRTHSSDPVPYLLYDSSVDLGSGVYSEPGVAEKMSVPAHTLMGKLVQTLA